MESTSTPNATPLREGGSPMRLGEHLEEKQESFNLESYLVERGYSAKGFYSEASVGCFASSRSRRRNKSTSVGKKCSEIRTALCRKFVSVGEVIGFKGHNIGDGEFNDTIQGRRNREEAIVEESEGLSSPSLSATEFSFYPEIRVEDNTSTSMDGSQSQIQPSPQTKESAADRMIQWSIVEENKQCSPDSVLDEIEASPAYKDGSDRQEERTPASNLSLPKKPTEDSIFSASLWELIIRSRREREGILRENDGSCSRNMSSKKALQQARQLLFDCVREAMESQGRQRKIGLLTGPEKLGRIICDNMRGWDRQSANRKTINRLLRSDFVGSFHEWRNFEGLMGDIVKEVGDQILEQMKDEMVEEIINFSICKRQQIC